MSEIRVPVGYVLIRRAFALLLALIGTALLIGGGWLMWLGGTPYYAIAGIAMLASGVLVWRGDGRGARLYGTFLAVTFAWTIWEVGADGWAMLPRLALPFAIGLGFLIPQMRGASGAFRYGWKHFAAALVGAGVIGAGLSMIGPQEPADPIYQMGMARGANTPSAAGGDGSADGGEWLYWGGDPGGTRFSSLEQISPANVGKLQVAWETDLGPMPEGSFGGLKTTPLKVGQSLYICTATSNVLSLDAETGRINWRFSAGVKVKESPYGSCRGVAYYRVPAATGACSERIITNTIDARLIAIDAATGRRCADFGNNGETSLKTGLGEVKTGYYFQSSAPTIVRGKIVLGGWIMDGQYWGEPSGVIRGFDAVTGEFAWAFDMGKPDKHDEPAAGETYTRSTPNSWAPMSADEQLGLVYAPTGNSVPDYYGAQRRPFDDKYSSSVLAINAETGALRWSFQTVHHDIWDYDVASQPTLVDIGTGAGRRHVLIQPTKRGEVFVLDRTTGKPIKAVEERPVPQDGIAPGERLSPTQPFSVGMPSFRGPDLRERDMWGITPLDQLWCRIKFREASYEGPATPTGLTYNIQSPGYFGGMNWGGVSIDRDRGIMIVNTTRMPNYNKLLTRQEADKMGLKPWTAPRSHWIGGAAPQANTRFAASIHPFISPIGVPCVEPPYGLISAVDLKSGKLLWSKPFGTARDSGPFGIASHLPLTMGVPNAGGSVVTRSGLVFIGATQEHVFRALDVRTGKELWNVRLPAGGQATPMTYWSRSSKRQFVVIAAGGNMVLQSKAGHSIVAYALPKTHQ